MKRVLVASAVILAMGMMAGCAQHGSQQPAAKRAVGNELIVLLPKPNGSIGGVIVRSGGSSSKILLNQAYAGARIDSRGIMQPVRYDADRATREFSSVIANLPGRPASFLLYFHEGNDEMTPDSEREFGRVFTEISARAYPEISVIGHTDAVGNTQSNDQLSRQRAQRVRDDLVQRGISADRIEVYSRGKREPLVPTSAGVSEPRNRRVEINVR